MRRFLTLVTTAALLPIGAAAQAPVTRELTFNSRSVIQIHAKLRFTTLIILPEQEEILDFVCGDKDFWIVSGSRNLAYVKPARAGATTNLDLVTARGTVYAFLLQEGIGDPDLKLYVTPDESLTSVLNGPQKFYSAADVETLKQDAAEARKQAEAAKAVAATEADAARADVTRHVAEAVNQFRAAYPTELQFPYRFKAHAKPFGVSAIFHDGRFTYIHASASELPSLYEVKDHQPNLVSFQVEHGVYIVPKVLERGYLAIGTQKLAFDTTTR